MATITLYELSNYNAGRLISETFDLDGFDNHDEYLAAIAEWLETVPGADGVEAEEWIVADAEDVPSRYIGEYDLDRDYWDYINVVRASHLDVEVFEAAAELGISPDDVEEAYQGEYDSNEDFAQQLAEDLGDVDENAKWPYTCIDWAWAARELMMDYSEHNGHYFRNL